MQTLILTLVGKDKPGIVDGVAQRVYQHGGNWLASNFAHMAGNFAGFAEIQVPDAQKAALAQALAQLPDLQIQLAEGGGQTDADAVTLCVSITGNDKVGIVQEVTGALSSFNINIQRFESGCESAPNWGSQLFKAEVHLQVPEGFHLDALQEALEKVADDLVIDIKLSDG